MDFFTLSHPLYLFSHFKIFHFRSPLVRLPALVMSHKVFLLIISLFAHTRFNFILYPDTISWSAFFWNCDIFPSSSPHCNTLPDDLHKMFLVWELSLYCVTWEKKIKVSFLSTGRDSKSKVDGNFLWVPFKVEARRKEKNENVIIAVIMRFKAFLREITWDGSRFRIYCFILLLRLCVSYFSNKKIVLNFLFYGWGLLTENGWKR